MLAFVYNIVIQLLRKMVHSVYVLAGECPPGTHVSYQLAGERLVVGRLGGVALHEPSVSREHAVLAWNGSGWVVTDLDSRNGTFVNGVAVQRKAVVPGDVLKFGRVVLELRDISDEGERDDDETRLLTRDASTFFPQGPGAQALVGRSEALRSAMKTAARAAKSNATVLLFGESGTGKELFAKLVWEESSRKAKKFLPVHTGAIESSLLASTLFGHEKGAFTGADKQKKGLFEEADGGTIFLDEIGEINSETQVKLLRVLQEGEFMRVGGTEPVKVDVRVICATNRDLAAAVKEGKFREDLYYRLNVIQIHLPPLRERRGDIADIVRHYVVELGGPGMTISPEALALLERYRWPGNVRELRNVVERMVVLSGHDRLEVDDIPPEVREEGTWNMEAGSSERPSAQCPPSSGSLAEIERRHIMTVLESCGGNKKLAAEKLGISRSSLYEKLKNLPDADTCPGTGHDVSKRRTETADSFEKQYKNAIGTPCA